MTRILDVMSPAFRRANPDHHSADLVRKWSQAAVTQRADATLVEECVLSAITHLQRSENQLHRLDLSDTGLTLLPPAAILRQLEGITILDLSNNHLPGRELSKLSALTSLKQLYLSDNPLLELPMDALNRNSRLAFLEINRCGLDCFPLALLELNYLDTLHLQGNSLSVLPDNIGYCLLHIAELDLRDTGIGKLPASLDYLNQLKVLS
ncbi:leucine-rich repeat domain-containing protein [Ewingella americana]|uniref:hypothetical protein n=1 Tax=Ewingella americana TaxID=41202 RepID=UPI0012ADBAA5|nr:hypothetical protein [Ewingella americana]MRT05926.1 hypothetical protein [Ewingella americana]